jgi:hypothetical protein
MMTLNMIAFGVVLCVILFGMTKVLIRQPGKRW